MKNSAYDLKHILDIERWQKLQDSLALMTELAIITVDYKGIPISEHSARRPFCAYVRLHPELGKLCQKCDSRGGLEAVRIRKPYTYLCHRNIVDIAIPIIIDNQYVGAIMAGEVKLLEKQHEHELERILHPPENHMLDAPEIRKLYDAIPILSLDKLLIAVQMLSDLCNYIVEEAVTKNFLLETYKNISSNNRGVLGSDFNAAPTDTIKKIRNELNHTLSSAYISMSSQEKILCRNKVLQPAFDYIFDNKNEMLSQKDASVLCHISTGHFSRLFKNETGYSYATFCTRLKTEWAKRLLIKTDLSITQISEHLGFNEPSYFVKVFRKFEGITPAYFRKVTPVEE